MMKLMKISIHEPKVKVVIVMKTLLTILECIGRIINSEVIYLLLTIEKKVICLFVKLFEKDE